MRDRKQIFFWWRMVRAQPITVMLWPIAAVPCFIRSEIRVRLRLKRMGGRGMDAVLS